jgi:single-strand DNA-binding protein
MASYSKLILIGFVVRDPEQRYLPNGDLVAEFTVPYTERKRDEHGNWEDGVTAWYRVSAFGKQAEVAVASLHKSTLVYVEGILLPRIYVDKGGQTRTSLDVRCRELRVLEKRANGAARADGVPVGALATADDAEEDVPDWVF